MMRRLMLLLAVFLSACDSAPAPEKPAATAAAEPSKPKRLPGDGVRVREMPAPAPLLADQRKRQQANSKQAKPAPAPQPASPKLEALCAQLEQAGFGSLKDIDWSEVNEEWADAASLLQAAGLCVWFDVETGSFPNEHDGLLRSLAAAAGEDMATVLFEEVAPDLDDEGASYTVNAYADGKRWSVTAENLGDWYDVDAVLRLGNAVLRDRGSEKRLLLLASQDQTAQIVVSTQAVLGAALKQGLLQSGDPAMARQVGQAFERQVLERMKSAGEAGAPAATQ